MKALNMNPAIVRIILRYVAVFLISYGVMGAPEAEQMTNDPLIIEAFSTALGTVLAIGVEFFYILAKRYGWKT